MPFKRIITTDYDDGCYPWCEVFAWLPVKTVSGNRVWLKKIYKRRVRVEWGSIYSMKMVQYATDFDILRMVD